MSVTKKKQVDKLHFSANVETVTSRGADYADRENIHQTSDVTTEEVITQWDQSHPYGNVVYQWTKWFIVVIFVVLLELMPKIVSKLHVFSAGHSSRLSLVALKIINSSEI